jgi:chromosome segregation ATPase
MDSELNFKLQELQELVQNIEKMENDLELLDHMLPGIDPTDQDELKKFEKEEQELLQKYQDAKMRLLTLKQELRRVELSKTRGTLFIFVSLFKCLLLLRLIDVLQTI